RGGVSRHGEAGDLTIARATEVSAHVEIRTVAAKCTRPHFCSSTAGHNEGAPWSDRHGGRSDFDGGHLVFIRHSEHRPIGTDRDAARADADGDRAERELRERAGE